MWEEASLDERKVYDQKEQEDCARYEREMAAWEKANKATSSSSGSAKKVKVLIN